MDATLWRVRSTLYDTDPHQKKKSQSPPFGNTTVRRANSRASIE
ncbi:hypothetical protein HNQ60_003547 [Povalibacter uvarum]|uniref:Uncharacterized protein n=1 Tax=Povalibacter uvarum TaxID=732238 RepID=A0A841HR06_9GAMM|nr:hypothetical protein [Povalibacter uvarum]